jgi:two-component system chemotaxis response regulator CheY
MVEGLSEKKIIVIDDMTSIRKIVVKLLVGFGANPERVGEAEDGAEALEKIVKNNYDLIISDWNMPVMSGIELLKVCKSDDNIKNTPFMLLTSESDKQQVVAALKARVDNYLTKPITKETLFRKICELVNK